jgi:acyl-CoA dehydrogenase
MHDELAAAFGQLLMERCTPAVVRAIERGESANGLWEDLIASGFLDALVPESADGPGLGLADVLSLVQACGYHAMPLPFAETMAARGVLAKEDRKWPSTPLALDTISSNLSFDERITLQAVLRVGQISGAAARILELSLAHANSRMQFGKTIGSFQAVQQQLAVMSEHVCAVRMASQLCFASSTNVPDRVLTAMAMVVAGEAAAFVTSSAHAVHGAIGICAEIDLQLYTRRMLAWRTDAGSASYWARQVGQQWWAAKPTASAVDFALDCLDRADPGDIQEV